jgi:hypothetical protein
MSCQSCDWSQKHRRAINSVQVREAGICTQSQDVASKYTPCSSSLCSQAAQLARQELRSPDVGADTSIQRNDAHCQFLQNCRCGQYNRGILELSDVQIPHVHTQHIGESRVTAQVHRAVSMMAHEKLNRLSQS